MAEGADTLLSRMRTTGRSAVPPQPSDCNAPEAVSRVADSVVQLLRIVRRAKARVLATAGKDVESATQILLRTVELEGPMRASALAASVGSDVSTVSRQVAAMVGRGLLERRADQRDGRASLLGVTEAGRTVIAEHEQGRQEFFEEVLASWTANELQQFAGLLERFTTSYDLTHKAWMLERSLASSPPAARKSGNRLTGPEEGITP